MVENLIMEKAQTSLLSQQATLPFSQITLSGFIIMLSEKVVAPPLTCNQQPP